MRTFFTAAYSFSKPKAFFALISRTAWILGLISVIGGSGVFRSVLSHLFHIKTTGSVHSERNAVSSCVRPADASAR